MKEGEFQIQEFYCSSNKKQPIRITSGTACQRDSLYKKHIEPNEQPVLPVHKGKFSFTKMRSNTISLTTNEADLISKNLEKCGKQAQNNLCVIKHEKQILTIQKTDSAPLGYLAHEEQKEKINEQNVDINRYSTDDSEFSKPCGAISAPQSLASSTSISNIKEENVSLKDKLTESLSPSPFRNQDPRKNEKNFERLVANSSTTKNLLFTEFYGSVLSEQNSHHVWKIALKDHIVHTMESMCIIKNLNPVPAHIRDKKMLPPDPPGFKKHSKTVVFDLDETLAHCITDPHIKADHEITVPLNTGESVKVFFFLKIKK